MREETVTTIKWWVDRFIGLMAAGALGLAGWSLTEIVGLKIRTSASEMRIEELRRVQNSYQSELISVEQVGTAGFRSHKDMDEARDLELRTRISRTEATLDKLISLSEKWAVAANDIAWIKAELEKGNKP